MKKPASSPASSTSSGRERLLEAAAAEFCQHGYAGSSIAAIARRAGISKSTIFHHFESKDALYTAVIAEAVMEFGQTMDHLLADHTAPAAVLSSFQRAHLGHLYRNRQVARLVLRELQGGAASGPAIDQVGDALSANYRRLLNYLEKARRNGQVREDADCEVAALLMYGANVFFFQNQDAFSKLPGLASVSDSERFASAVADLVLRGLEPQAPGRKQ